MNRVEIEELTQRLSKVNERAIVKLQATIRGYLLRKKISDRWAVFHNNIDKILMIQSWWRMVLHSRRQRQAIIAQKEAEKHDEKLNSRDSYDRYKIEVSLWMRCSWNESKIGKFISQEEKIVKVQALWRGRAARRALHSLLHLDKPPFSAVRNFLPILDFNAEDYDEDLQLQVKIFGVEIRGTSHNR